MGKQQKKYNFSMSDMLGSDINSDPLIQAAQKAEQARANQDVLKSTSILPSLVQFHSKDAEVYKNLLGPGQGGGSAEETDYEVAANQSTFTQMMNGARRLFPVTATKLMSAGYSTKQAYDYLINGNKEAFTNDDENVKAIKDFEDSIKAAMPIYATKEYDKGSLFDQMGTAKFWGDDLGDGVAFLAAQMIGTKGLAATLSWAGKGAQIAGAASGATQLLSKVPQAAKVANFIANNFTAAAATTANVGFTAAMQAQDTATQIKEQLAGKINPETGLEYTKEEVNTIAGEQAAHTFNFTSLVHILPAAYETKIFLGLNKAKLGAVNAAITKGVNSGEVTMEQILSGTGDSALYKGAFKTAAKGAAKGALIEGVYEENIEQSIQNYDISEGVNGKNVGTGERILNYGMGMISNFGTKEDGKAILLGAILGGPMGGVSAYQGVKSFNEKLSGRLNSLQESNNMYQEDIRGMHKTHAADVLGADGKVISKKGSLVFDEKGQPIEDTEKQKNLLFQIINQKKNYDRQTVATVTGNKDLAGLNENMALSSMVYRELGSIDEDDQADDALTFLKWRIKKQLEEQNQTELKKEETAAASKAAVAPAVEDGPKGNIEGQQAISEATAASTQFNGKNQADLSKVINENLAKIDRISDAYKAAQSKGGSLTKLGQSAHRSSFNKIAQKGLYYEEVKRQSLEEMVQARKEALKDPLADQDKITKEIEAITRLTEDSYDKSKAYLNNTDELYKNWADPQSKLARAESEIQTAKTDREVSTASYKRSEITENEGLDENNFSNQELISQPIKNRVNKPVGARNRFFWNAGNDMTKMDTLNKKIQDFQDGKTTLADVATYAKESITNIDAETSQRLNSLLVSEKAALDKLTAELDAIPRDISEMDEDMDFTFVPNPEYLQKEQERDAVAESLATSEGAMKDKQEAQELNMINQKPENVEKHLIKQFALKFFDKGKYIIKNALNLDGSVKKEYMDFREVTRAIDLLTTMRNAMEDRLGKDGDLEGVTGLSFLISDADAMIAQLEVIKTQAAINSANRDAQQAYVNQKEAASLILGLGVNPETQEVEYPEIFAEINAILNGTLMQSIADIANLTDHQYEATVALLHKVQTMATPAQLSAIKKNTKVEQSWVNEVVKGIIGTAGTNGMVAKRFAQNPQQFFMTAWMNTSNNNFDQGYARVENTKGSPFNTFKKNNDIDELLAEADKLPEDTKELGMSKSQFVSLAEGYKYALALNKVQSLLSTPLKPIVEAQIKFIEEEELAPTTQQDIAIREGVSWLNGKTSLKPFGNWGFLRGIAGTGKTNVVLKWILQVSGIDKGNVISTALTQTATDVVGKSTGTQALTFDVLENQIIAPNIKLIVIDEYATIDRDRLQAFHDRIQISNPDTKVLMLGDPTQLTPRVYNNNDVNDIVFNDDAGNIKIISPVTVVYRSDVSAVNEASDIFQDNNRKVESITVRSDRDVNSPLAQGVHTSTSSGQIAEVIAANIAAEKDRGLAPRTRAIIVGTEEDKAKYEGLGAEVMTVYDAQSKTYEEVYVDINPTIFSDAEKGNSAMYTAASRAKKYTFIVYPKGENIVDTSLKDEAESNLKQIRESKVKFHQAKTAELAMMDGLAKGESIKNVSKDKKVKEDVQNAGKSALDIEEEQSRTEEDPDVVAEVPEIDEDSDENIEDKPAEETELDSEEQAPPIQVLPPLPNLERESLDHIDAEAYPSLRKGVKPESIDNTSSPVAVGNEVIYLYHTDTNGQNVVSVMAKSSDGNWVRLSKIFAPDIQTDPRYDDIMRKIAGMIPFHSDKTDVLNGSGTPNPTPYTREQLNAHVVRDGRVGASQYLRFLYKEGLKNSKSLAKDLSSIFKNKFYPKSQAHLADKVSFKIFTTTEISSKTWDSAFTPKPGTPYAVIGSNGVSYKNAKFIRLQPQAMQQADDQIQTLKTLTAAVEKVQNYTGIQMGTAPFHDLIRIFRSSLEIYEEPTAEGTVSKVRPKADFTNDDIIESAEALFEAGKRDGNTDPLKNIPKDQLQDAISAIQDLAYQLYGIKISEGTYTQAEVDAMGDEFEAVPQLNKKMKKGEELFYANKKGSAKAQYIKVSSLDVKNSRAQLALDQIARANEFAGNKRIRIKRYLKNTARGNSYKGKSLISDEGGSTRLFALMNIAAIHLIKDDTLSRKDAMQAVRDKMKVAGTILVHQGEDPGITYLKTELQKIGDSNVDRLVTNALEKKEVPPITLGTLQLITGDENFSADGHRTKEAYPMLDRDGQPVTQTTFLRKPLIIDQFNSLGEDPVANADALAKLVTTSFSDISNTKIEIDFSKSEPSAGTEPVINPAPEATVSSHEDIDKQILALDAQIAAEKNVMIRIGLGKTRSALILRKGGLAYDSNADRPDPGQRISVAQALAEVKRLIPNITEGELEFVSRSMISQFANPGENLLGLFDKSKIFLETTEQGVYDKVLRHEVMHKIYNEFLSTAERKALRRELDPKNTLSGEAFDEYLADAFMIHKANPQANPPVTRSILEKILNWFGFYGANQKVLGMIFQKIEDGKYTKPVREINNVRRAFSDIKANYQNVANYKLAVKTVHGMVYDTMIKNDLNQLPFTMPETKRYVRRALLVSKAQRLLTYQNAIKDLDDLKALGNEYLTYVAEQEVVVQDAATALTPYQAMFPEENTKVFDELWSDIYSFDSSSDEEIEYVAEDSSASGLLEFTKQSDEVNQEAKVTVNVKNFLSFIFRPNGTRVDPRYAYLECLRNLNGLVSGENNLEEALRATALSNGINLNPTAKSDGKYIIEYLIRLINSATSKVYTDDNKVRVDLDSHVRFVNQDFLAVVNNGIDLSTMDKEAIKTLPDSFIAERLENETTASFINRITGFTGFDPRILTAHFKQMQAQESLREIMSNFLSQREGNFMIAEESRKGRMGNTQTVLKYMDAQLYGAERVIAVDVENAIKAKWLEIPGEVWDEFKKPRVSDAEKLVGFFKALGLNTESAALNSSGVKDLVENLVAFKFQVDKAYENGADKLEVIKSAETDGLEAETETVQYRDLEYMLNNDPSTINKIVRVLTKNSADARPAKYQSVDGTTRYSFHNGNQASETMERVIKATGTHALDNKANTLPAHLRTPWAGLNIFVDGAINRIHRIVDHDGMRREKGEEFAVGYAAESNSENLQRQFSYGFLGYLKANAIKGEKNLKYIQFFYTISNRPRMMGGEVNLLNPKGLRDAARKMLVQHLTQPVHDVVKNYDKFRSVNMEEMGNAIDKHIKIRSEENYAKLLNDETKINAVLDTFDQNLKDLAKQFADRMVAEKVSIGDEASAVVSLMKDPKRKYIASDTSVAGFSRASKDNLGYTSESILPIVESWVANNYINGFFMNQLGVGNFNYFKTAIEMVKRMSGVFAPGLKGLVSKDNRFFMKEKFRAAVFNDPYMFSDELSEIFEGTPLKEEMKKDLDKDGTEKGFEMADGQGFMLPSRAVNITAGFGQAYNAGVVFKPAHYEVAPRFAADGITVVDYVPVMLKYSSVVLSDDLVAKFPKLKAMRDAMLAMEVDELVFDSVNKVGVPNVKRALPKKDEVFAIQEEAVLTLSNENFRLQLNPKHATYSDVSVFSQLLYFLNADNNINPEAKEVNNKSSAEVYKAIGKIIDLGLKNVKAGLTASGKVSKSAIQRTLTGAGNERIAEMLKEVGLNMPNIANKALIQSMNMFYKKTAKIEFKGGKFVLQSAYGIEMIKEDSERFDSLSDLQKKAHTANWTKYGNEARAKIAGAARNLKYGTDANGRLYAEVLIDKSYADKAKVGQYLLPDMMGYRIPSTELHSSIAVIVAGYYDSQGSNVIIAPPELVKQHGSDFDVDSLYIVGRETIEEIPELGILDVSDSKEGVEKSVPVGYQWDKRIDRYTFQPLMWEERIAKWYKQAGTDKKKIKQIDKIYMMLQRNIIVENMLNVISHPANLLRMTEPISTQVIKDTLERLNLNTSRVMDLSNPLDNLDVYNSNFQGAKLVGIFANGAKAIAYMKKAGASEEEFVYPQLRNSEEKNRGVNIAGVMYDQFKEQFPDGTRIWPVIDALINTATDNVKEQQLYKINASNSTGKMYVAAQAMGIPLDTSVTLMLQPIGLEYTRQNGKMNQLKAELKTAYNLASDIPVESFGDLKALSAGIEDISETKMRGFINRSVAELTPSEIIEQVKVLEGFESLASIGEDISTFSKAVSVVQKFPVLYEEIEKMDEQWNKMFEINGDEFKTHSNFSFNIDNLFKAQPNIHAAYKAFQAAKLASENTIMKHANPMRALVKELIDTSGVKLSFTQNTEQMKDELISYLISSMYSEDNRTEAPIEFMYKDKVKVATGKQAWSEKFIDKIVEYKKTLSKDELKNSFISKIGVKPSYGLKSLTFSMSSNSDYQDSLEMQEAFETLPEELKEGFVKYAVLNYGLKFGVRNYSMFIPAAYLKPVDAHIESLNRAIRNNSIEAGIVNSGELLNIKENFLLRLAVNNAEKLGFISSKDYRGTKGIPAIPTEGRKIIISDAGGPKEVDALDGMDEYYYNRKYANPLVENGSREFDQERFPLFIRNGENIAMMRVNPVDSDFVYYQKVGMKNWVGGYDGSTEALKGNYSLDKYFGKDLIPLPVADNLAESFTIVNAYVKTGSKVIIYNYNNESRDQGRFGIVDSVAEDLTNPDRKTITIRDIDAEQLSPTNQEYIGRMAPLLKELSSRFKVPVRAVMAKDMPRGHSKTKGMIHEGEVLINMENPETNWDTPFHEIAHPLIDAIYAKNPKWFQNLLTEFRTSSEGKQIMEQVRQAYPNLSEYEQEIEGLVTLIGEVAGDTLSKQSSLFEVAKRLFRALGTSIKKFLSDAGVINLDSLSNEGFASLTINDLAQILSNKDAGISVDLSGFIKTGRESRQLDTVEQRLFKEGRIVLSCKI